METTTGRLVQWIISFRMKIKMKKKRKKEKDEEQPTNHTKKAIFILLSLTIIEVKERKEILGLDYIYHRPN